MAKNIRSVYETCRNVIQKAEEMASKGQEPSQGLLDTLSNAFKDIIEYEKFYLIQCQDKFYGSILMELDIGIDFTQRGPVDLKVDRTPFGLGINPLFCGDYNFSEFTGLIVDEITKMIWLHPADYSKLNHEKDEKKHEMLDKASSAASSSIVKKDIRLVPNSNEYGSNNGCRLPNDIYTTTDLNSQFNIRTQEAMPMEYYYNILSRYKKQDGGGNSGNQNMGSQANNNGQASGNQNMDTQANNNGQGQQSGSNKNGVATKNNSNGQNTHQWEGGDSDDLKDEIKSMVLDAYNSLDEKSRGFIPSSIMSQIKVFMEPPQINWIQILKKMIGSVPIPYRRTRTRLDRRQPFRADISGKLPKRIVDIVCAFDTSGSMSDRDLKYCVNEVFNILKSYEGYRVTIIECDADIQRVYQAKKVSDVKTKMQGRGGTSFLPVIQYINGEAPYNDKRKYPLAGNFRNSLLVYFTDGYGNSEIPKPKTFRNLWVVLNDKNNLSVKNPYGDVKSIYTDDNWKKMRSGI